MTLPDAATIVFVGPMGAGKTSIGKRVARELGLTFTDTDAAIVRGHGSIPKIFASHGEAHFRSLERAAVVEALSRGGVIALGGGAVMDAETRADLTGHRVVLLTVSPDTVRSRIGGSNRPLLDDDDPVARWGQIFDERRPYYEEVADVTFDSSVGRVSSVAAAVTRWVRGEDPIADPAPHPASEGSA